MNNYRLTRVVFAIVFFHHALVAKAQVHFGSVGSANRVVIVRTFGLASAGRRHRCRRAGRLQFVTGADLLVISRSTVDRDQYDGQTYV